MSKLEMADFGPMARTIRLEDGKYEFDLQDGQLIGARRHGEDWPAGLENRFSKSFVAALSRIAELEDTVSSLADMLSV